MPRPKEFVEEEALEKAMQVFWHKGYESTSVQDLLNGMGINRGSLYETFGDKRNLYLASMDRYCRDMVDKKLSVLYQSQSALEGIRNFFTGALHMPKEKACKGCFLTNSIVETKDEQVTEIIQSALKKIEEGFYNSLMRAQNAGELQKEKDPRALARFLTAQLQSLAVMAKTKPEPDVVKDVVYTALSVLDG